MYDWFHVCASLPPVSVQTMHDESFILIDAIKIDER